MFGTKLQKQKRLERIVNLLTQHQAGLRQSEIARFLQAERSTVLRDLVALEARGVLLTEDEQGRLSLFSPLTRTR